MAPLTLSSRSGGFALVEALASLVIIGLIGLMVVVGVQIGRRSWTRLNFGETVGDAVDTAQAALRDRIELTFPATLYDQNPPVADFTGQADDLVFLANPPRAERPSALRRYHLLLSSRGDLVLASVSDLAPAGAPVVRQVLLDRVRQIDLAYFGAAPPDQVRRWRGAWREQPVPPELVRLRLGFAPGDARRWPDLIVHPRANIDAACLLNPVTHHCKGRL